MMEADTRTKRGQNMPIIHGKIHIMGQECFTARRHRLPAYSTRLLLIFGRALRNGADALNQRVEIQLVHVG